MPEVVYTNVIRTAKLAMRALGQPIEITGLEHLPRTGPAMLALNHIGYVDFIYGGFAPDRIGRRVRFMAKRELFEHKVSGPIMRACRHIPVDRADGEGSLAEALRHLSEGELVGIFPEATISRSMEIKELKTGAARIAQRAGAPLIPMVLWGTQRLMTKDHDKDFSRGTAITIRIGPPIPVTGADPIAETRALREALQGLLAESIAAYPQHEPGAWWLPASYGGSAPTPERAAELDAAEKRERAAKRAAARAQRHH
ncbi:lysophospholipid acyltransferase family protein [Nocardioides cynanchi]|uniref:lysophospholipid acyltransferase family protein n=1 Tax=Nocardioides cynanchi TaxID=2558918 RepID=UPI0012458CC1|nr:lysophospholipid acyltransferase family protein [Nocardioides cynanchi]